ncbi:hypothetical protein ACSSS7_003001 [Eimeria intestinalis]
MKSLQIVALASAALFAFSGQAAAEDEKLKQDITAEASKVDCLAAFNKARASAGLDPFTDSGNRYDDGVTDADAFRQNVCKSMLKGKEPDCEAAVTYFKGALKNFGELPPPFESFGAGQGTNPYSEPRNVGFVGLYNPQAGAAVNCGFFKCTNKITPTDSRDTANDNASTTVYAYGLTCSSSPNVLEQNKEPFTKEQFAKIKEAIENSAYTAMPAVAALVAAAAAGIALF